MDSLLPVIKTELAKVFDGVIRASDIFITPHAAFIPHSVRMPCCGIKDGKIKVIEQISDSWEIEAQVRFCLYQEIRRDEAGITGDPASGAPGVLDLARILREGMARNLLGLERSGVIAALWTSESGSELFDRDGTMTVRKVCTYTYHREIRG